MPRRSEEREGWVRNGVIRSLTEIDVRQLTHECRGRFEATQFRRVAFGDILRALI